MVLQLELSPKKNFLCPMMSLSKFSNFVVVFLIFNLSTVLCLSIEYRALKHEINKEYNFFTFYFFSYIYLCSEKYIFPKTMFLPITKHLCSNVETFFEKFAF